MTMTGHPLQATPANPSVTTTPTNTTTVPTAPVAPTMPTTVAPTAPVAPAVNPAPTVTQPAVQPQTVVKPVNKPSITVDDILDNPEEAIGKIVNQAVAKTLNTVNQEKKFYDDLHNEAPELKNLDWLVQSVLGEKKAEWASLSLPDARAKLIEESRRRITQLKQATGERVETVENRPTGTIGSTGVPSPSIPDEPAKPVSFLDQLKARNKRRA